jgi:hypothetical protein
MSGFASGPGKVPVVSAVPVEAVAAYAQPAPGGQVFDENGIVQYLTANGWPNGLQRAFRKNLSTVCKRFFILDNSGSMATNDGHRIVGEGVRKVSAPSSRWAELGDFTRFHAGLAEAGKIESEFRLLNGSPPLLVGSGTDDGVNYRRLMEYMSNSPSGGTPLCYHISQVIAEIYRKFVLHPFLRYYFLLLLSFCPAMVGHLRNTGQRVVVVIATDGESSDGDIAAAMRPFQQMPVWVVIRLCTDEDRIVEYWNNIDKVLGKSEYNTDLRLSRIP